MARAGLAWRPDSLDLHLLAASSTVSSSDPEASRPWLDHAASLASPGLEQARVQLARLTAATVRGDLPGAVEAGLTGLSALDRSLVDATDRGRLEAAVAQTHAALQETDLGELPSLSEAAAPRVALEMQILSGLVPAAFFTDQQLFTAALSRASSQRA